MLNMIDWDKVFNWQVWQYVKWVYMFIVTVGLIWLIYANATYKQQLKDEKGEHESTISTVKQVLFDTRATDKKLIKILSDYIMDRGEK